MSYPTDIRDELLDVLFTPNKVASLHILKGVLTQSPSRWADSPALALPSDCFAVVMLQSKSEAMHNPRMVRSV